MGTAIPLEDFYPFGATASDSSLLPNDDGSSVPILLNHPFPFFGRRHTSLIVNNNGLLSFDTAVSQFTPASFPLGDGRMVVAPYWGDVDTLGTGIVWYRETSNATLLEKAKSDIRGAFVNQMFFEPTTLFIATWDHVGYYSSHTDLTNTFQCILVTNGRRSFAIFLYANGLIQWTTGDASGGSGGFGGTPAQVGFNAGDGERFASVPGSQTSDIVNIDSTSNVDRRGVWIFRIDEEEIQVTQECRNDPTVKLVIGPRFGNILGGTAIHVTGPCFDEMDLVVCSFEDEKPDVFVVNNRTAICVSPRFEDVGWKTLTLQIFRDRKEVYMGQSRFYASLPEDTSDITLDEDTLLVIKNSADRFTVHWDPLSLLPMVDPTFFTVDLKLYRLDEDRKDWEIFLNIIEGHPNTGVLEFSMPSSDDAETNVYPVALRISVGEQAALGAQGEPVSDIIKSAQDRVSQWFSSFFYYAVNSLDLLDECLMWYGSEDPNIGEMLLGRVPDCCQTVDRAAAPNSGFVRDTNELLVSFFHPGAASCYRQATITSENMESGQQCCYGRDGNLITGPMSGGTVDRVAPTGNFGINIIRHFFDDVLPAFYCCQGRFKDETCNLYYDRRPSGGRESCEPPRPAFTFGDPHIVTLDGLKYTFNGLGEYILIDTTDDSFTLQGRMIQARDDDGNVISATAYSAIVAEQSDSDTVQFQVVDSEIIVDDIDILVNGELLDFEGLPNQQFNNVTLQKMDNSVSALFSSGVHIEVKVENGIISVLSATLPQIYKSKTTGLMGNYNGDPADDLLPRGKEDPIPSLSGVEEIHKNFGVTWIINSTEDSLFTYNEQESWSTFYKPDFVPFFEPIFSNSLLEQQANSICGDDVFCRYDIAATGRTDVGQATLQGNMEFERIINISLPVVCDPPCDNGVCVSNDTCSCSEGYTGETCDEPIVSECVENLCENGGTCTRIAATSVCTCPDGYTGLLCQESTIECPPYCTKELCSAKSTRKSLCTIKNPPVRDNCNNPCRITFCHACYYSDESLEVHEHCETCPFYPNMNQTEARCFKRWAGCARRSVFPKFRGSKEKTEERFKCFEHPCF